MLTQNIEHYNTGFVRGNYCKLRRISLVTIIIPKIFEKFSVSLSFLVSCHQLKLLDLKASLLSSISYLPQVSNFQQLCLHMSSRWEPDLLILESLYIVAILIRSCMYHHFYWVFIDRQKFMKNEVLRANIINQSFLSNIN